MQLHATHPSREPLPRVLARASASCTLHEIQVSVVFGTPSRNCAGSGVCMVTPYGSRRLARFVCPHVMAYISLVAAGSWLRFRFPKAAGCHPPGTRRHFFVEEPFQVSASLVRPWALPTLWLAPGAYHIRENADSWWVHFKIDTTE